jgi:hypothetical protein
MVLPPFRRHLAWPSMERVVLMAFVLLLVAYLVVLLVQPSAVGRGGR